MLFLFTFVCVSSSIHLRGKINQKVIQPIFAFLKQGMTPHKLSLALSLGFCFGLFPVIGVTTLFCLVAAFLLKVNLAAIQLVNYLIYPLQIITILPLMKLGSYLVNVNPVPYSIEELIERMSSNFWETLEVIWLATLLGILAWAVIIIPISAIVYFVLRLVFNRLAKTGN